MVFRGRYFLRSMTGCSSEQKIKVANSYGPYASHVKTNVLPLQLLVFTASSCHSLRRRDLLDCKNAFKSDELLKAASEEERGRERERERRALKSLAVTATSVAL